MTFSVDSAFLEIFDFPLKEGNRQTALWNPQQCGIDRIRRSENIWFTDLRWEKPLPIMDSDTLTLYSDGNSERYS